MASKKRLIVNSKKDSDIYAEFMKRLISNTINATAMLETLSEQGRKNIEVENFDDSGHKLPNIIISVRNIKITKLEYT